MSRFFKNFKFSNHSLIFGRYDVAVNKRDTQSGSEKNKNFNFTNRFLILRVYHKGVITKVTQIKIKILLKLKGGL